MPAVPIERIMTRMPNIHYLEVPGTRDELLGKISETTKRNFVVVKKGTTILEGIVGRSDVLKDPSETQISMLMNRDVPKASPKTTNLECAQYLYDNKLEILPVVEGEELVGLVSITDIIGKVVSTRKIETEIDNYYRRRVGVVWIGTPVNVAIEILRLSAQDALPVIDEKGLRGIASAQDFLSVAEVEVSERRTSTSTGAEFESSSWDSASVFVIGDKRLVLPDTPVSEIMTPKDRLEVAYPYSTIRDVAKKARTRQIDQLPIVSPEDDLVGLVTSRDILRAFIDWAIDN